MKHPLAEEIKSWADAPDAWQWQYFSNTTSKWRNCPPCDVFAFQLKSVRLVPKRNLIPSHLLPEGWEVERLSNGDYRWRNGKNCGGATCRDMTLWQLLRHIDPEAA